MYVVQTHGILIVLSVWPILVVYTATVQILLLHKDGNYGLNIALCIMSSADNAQKNTIQHNNASRSFRMVALVYFRRDYVLHTIPVRTSLHVQQNDT